MISLTVYTTAGCHLCDQAFDLLKQLDQKNLNIVTIDIATNDKLVDHYGTAIPVIKFSDNSELNWPFTLEELSLRLSQHHN